MSKLNPRSFTANENFAKQPMAETGIALTCGHRLTAEDIKDIEPGEAVWCTECQKDFPVEEGQ